MDSFKSYLLRDLYRDIEKLGDRLAEAEPLIDWEAFRPIIQSLYTNQGPSGGRPNIDEVVMVKMLVLQAWYGLSDPAEVPGWSTGALGMLVGNLTAFQDCLLSG